MMNINLDSLKNINVNDLKEKIKSRPEIFIRILLIAITLFATMYIYKRHTGMVGELTEETQKMQEKLAAVENQKKVQQEYTDFMKSLPKSLPTDQVIDKISDFAVARDVQITSFSPTKNKNDAFTEMATLSINVTTQDYNNMILFIKDIEESPYSLRIEKWLGKLSDKSSEREELIDSPGRPQQIIGGVEASIEVVSMKFKDG